MKKYKINNKIIDAETLIEAVEKYNEMAPKNMTIEALRKDEEAAIDAYKVAIENLQGVASNKAIEVLRGIMKDEIDHLEKLNAILYGREENVEVDEHEKTNDSDEEINKEIEKLEKELDEADDHNNHWKVTELQKQIEELRKKLK